MNVRTCIHASRHVYLLCAYAHVFQYYKYAHTYLRVVSHCYRPMTQGVGRTVLESQGWREGKGVGKTEEGRAHIIDSDGQHPRDKTGLG